MMKKTGLILAGALLLSCSLNAQYYKVITVPSGTPVIEKFPPSVRYLNPQFVDGKVFNAAGAEKSSFLNYNLLTKEIEFIQGKDTLAIANKKDISMAVIAQDTFIYRSEYLKRIHSEPVVLERDAINLKEVVKNGAMGQPNRTSNVDAYTSMPYMTNLYMINPDANMEFRRELQFYILNSQNEMVEIRKKTVLDLYPENQSEIQKFLKDNKVKFDERKDIVKFASFLSELK